MGRPLRVEYPGAFYHVINRGNNQEQIFKILDVTLIFISGNQSSDCSKQHPSAATHQLALSR